MPGRAKFAHFLKHFLLKKADVNGKNNPSGTISVQCPDEDVAFAAVFIRKLKGNVRQMLVSFNAAAIFIFGKLADFAIDKCFLKQKIFIPRTCKNQPSVFADIFNFIFDYPVRVGGAFDQNIHSFAADSVNLPASAKSRDDGIVRETDVDNHGVESSGNNSRKKLVAIFHVASTNLFCITKFVF